MCLLSIQLAPLQPMARVSSNNPSIGDKNASREAYPIGLLLDTSRFLSKRPILAPRTMHDFEPLVPGAAAAAAAHALAALEVQRMQAFPAPAIKCPRCQSENTKFCYYNNYSLRQPRHYCKSCRRYWTRGGVLRNVPMGGGSRKKSSSKRPPKTASPPLEKPFLESALSSSDCSGITGAEESRLLPNPNPSADLQDPLAKRILSETGNSENLVGFEISDLDPPRPAEYQQLTIYAAAPPSLPLPPPPPILEARVGSSGYWDGPMDGGLFDLYGGGGGDGAAYWSHGQWGDTDVSRYLP